MIKLKVKSWREKSIKKTNNYYYYKWREKRRKKKKLSNTININYNYKIRKEMGKPMNLKQTLMSIVVDLDINEASLNRNV